MKRLSIALAALGLSASAFAAYPAATDPTEVSVPLLPGGFVVGATAYYLQPSDSNGDLDYAIISGFAAAPAFFSEIKAVEPEYDWGWGVNVGYIFPGTGNDINASWFHLDTEETDTVGSLAVPFVGPGIAFVDPAHVLDNDLEFGNYARGRAEYDIDQVDVTGGQYINVGCRLILHPNAGVRWTSLDRELKARYAETFFPAGVTFFDDELFTKDESEFSGVGPLAGIDATYYIGWGLGAVAHFDTALLVGDVDDKLDALHIERDFPTGVVVGSVESELKTDSNRRVVPVLDGKLGLDWTYVFNNTTDSDLTLEVGYQVSNYFNAVDRIEGVVGSVDAAGNFTSALAAAHFTSDVGLNGPYVNLTFHA
jgi:hypothetical protein